MTPETLVTVGRGLLALYFVASGVRHFWIFGGATAMMKQRGVPLPAIALGAGTAFEIIAGVALAAGFYIVPVGWGLIVFTLAASVIALDFWNQQGPQRDALISAWLANIAVIGGLLVVMTTA